MSDQELSAMTNEELLAEKKKLKSFSVFNAFLIGILIGIIIYSLYNNTFGFLMIIPVYLIYTLRQNPKNKRLEEINAIIKHRELQ